MIGKRLGHYEILEQLGQGGMGVVYKARDVKLDRLVAIKVLPPDKTADPTRKQRFIREARAASALNHPNIVVIHDIAEDQGIDFIVMEYVPGRTLDHAIPRKGMRTGEALRYAAQIAAALSAAHEAGITHRDLKPGNVMVTEKAVVKVLDFGLAKLTERGSAAPAESASTRTQKSDTEEGAILGTVAYMSPEQAEGRAVDSRSDIFSFGAVLYEMLTGQKAFQGETKLSTLSAILKEEPQPVRAVAGEVPGELERIVSRCLKKNPARRYQSTADLQLAIEELREESDSGRLGAPASAGGVSSPRAAVPRWAWAAVGCVLLAGAGWWALGRRNAAGPPAAAGASGQGPVLTQLTFDTGLTTEPAYWGAGNLIAYASDRATNGQNLDVWIQQVNGGEARRLTNHAADDHEPSFSPDGGIIAFRSERDGGGIYLIPTIGGVERKLADAGHDPRFSPDGKWIAYWKGDPAPYGQFMSTNGANNSVWVVAAAGGSPRQLAPGLGASRPVWSPDSKMLLFAVRRPTARDSDWYTMSLEGGAEPKKTGLLRLLTEKKFVPRLAYMTWTPAGLIFTGQIGDSVNTWKVAIDPVKREITGEPERITSGSGIESHPNWAGNALVYANSLSNDDIWYLPVDHLAGRAKGDPVRLTNTTASDVSTSVSHDGTRIAFGSIMAGSITVMVHDLVTGNRMRLMSVEASGVPGLNISPDGNQVGWQTARPDGKLESHVAALDGTSRRVCEDCQLRSWDGEKPSQILFTRRGASYLIDPATGTEAKVLDTVGSGIHLSWDARWVILYELDGSASHIYLCPVRPDRVATKADYIEISDGKAMDILPELSPGIDVAYFLSNRDGFQCLWARRLDPATKRPSGEPFAVQHFHSAKLSPAYVPGGRRRVDTARDKIVFTMAERSGNIWKADLPAGDR